MHSVKLGDISDLIIEALSSKLFFFDLLIGVLHATVDAVDLITLKTWRTLPE